MTSRTQTAPESSTSGKLRIGHASSPAVTSDVDDESGKPVTLAQAIDRYETDLKVRGGDVYNAKRVRLHLPEALGSKTVAILTASLSFGSGVTVY